MEECEMLGFGNRAIAPRSFLTGVSAVAKNWQTRLTDTLNYIDQIPNIPAAHRAQLQVAVGRQQAASDLISLGGARPFTNVLETQRRHALRGLLLCLVWAGAKNAIDTAKRHYQNEAEGNIRDAIASFFPVANADAQSAVQTATQIVQDPAAGASEMVSKENMFVYRRGAPVTRGLVNNLGYGCYENVSLLLYMSGVVSLRWLLTNVTQPALELPKQWSWGEPFNQATAARGIAGGRICRFHRPPGPGLHYTLSVGSGNCIGNHNSDDVIVNWRRDRLGQPPTKSLSQFSIAGYLATTIALAPQIPKYRDPQVLGMRSAPCGPMGAF